MMRWVVIVVSGICTVVSCYMAYLAYQAGDDGTYLFAGFGLLFGIPFGIAVVNVLRNKRASWAEVDEVLPEKPAAVRFVPHWFMMAALIAVVVCILAAILIPLLFD